MTQTTVQGWAPFEHRGTSPAAGDPGRGWFADPLGQWPLRWWSGTSWTVWVWDGESVHAGPLSDRRHLQRSDLAHLAFVEGVFLPELAAHGALSAEQAQRAADLIRELVAEVVEPTAVVAPPVPAPAAPMRTVPASGSHGWVGPATAARPVPVLPPISRPVPRQPGPVARWWQRTQESVRSDLAVHGVAYLGVLLFFVGAFGLVAFAFGDVQPQLRPVAEIVIAAVPFGAAALLLRRGAEIVGRALEVTGGLLLPVMVMASVLDGVGVPPDLTGPALVVGLTAACAILTGAYAWWALRHRDSALRYVVAPMAWLTAAMASLGLGRPIPSGPDVVTPGSAQVGVALAALVATLVWARLAPRAHLAGPTCASAVPGTIILALLAWLTWISEAAPWPVAILASGVLGVAALELLSSHEPPADRLAPAFTSIVQPVWWWTSVVALTAPTGRLWGYAVGVLGFLVLIELAGRARRPGWALAIPTVGAVAFGPPIVEQPWLAVAVLVLASAWALLRRRAPFRVRGARAALDVAALVLPLVTMGALCSATNVGTGLLAACLLLLAATAVGRWSTDPFWARSWVVWLLALGAVSLGVGAAAMASALPASFPLGDPWLLVVSAAALTATVTVGPRSKHEPDRAWDALRTAGVVGLGSWSWLLACWAGGLPEAVRGVALAVAALALVCAAHLAVVRRTAVAAALGASGHVLAVVAVPLAGGRWGLFAALALFTAGWAVTTVADSRQASPVGSALATIGSPARYAAPGLFSGGLVATTLTGLWVGSPDDWTVTSPVAMCVIALALALATRLGRPDHVARTFSWTSFLLPFAALAVATLAWLQVLALGTVIVTVLVLHRAVRWQVMTWTAWAAPTPLMLLLARQASAAFADRPEVIQAAVVLVVVGSAMVLGAAAADLRHGPWVPRWWPRSVTLVPPVVLGVAQGFAGLSLLASQPAAPVTGWLLIGAAAALTVLAFLTRIGLLAGGSVLLAWIGAVVLITPDRQVSPLAAVVAVAILLALAELGHRLAPERAWWSRWDVPVAVAAAPIAAAAVASAWGTADEVAVDLLIGLLAVGAALRVRTLPWLALPLAVVGAGLVLAGAGAAGPWWFAAAVAGLAALLTVAAVMTTGSLRLALQLGGALAFWAAWASVIRAAEWTAVTAADLTLWGAGALALAFACAAWIGRPAASWVRVWGGLSALTLVAAAGACWAGVAELEPVPAVAGGLALLTAALLVAAPPLRSVWLRDVAGMTGLASLLTALAVLDATPTGWVLTLTTVSVSAAIGTLLLAPTPRRITIEVGVAATGIALMIALTAPGDPILLVAALAAGSGQAAAVGSALRSLVLQAFSPLLACAAWLVFAGGSLTGQVEAWTIPVGLALLVVVGLWRRDRIRRGAPVASVEIVAVEAVGVLLLVGASLVLMVTESLIHVLPALGLGVAVTAWGVLTRVRRRVLMGAATVVAAVLLLVAVPMAHLMPEWRGAGLWVLLLSLGIVAMLVAALIERGRVAARAAAGRFRDLTSGWE